MPRIDTKNRAHYWCPPNLPGLSCLLADFTTHDYAPHRHEALVVAVTEQGGAEFRSRGETNEADSSVLLVFNPDEPHSGRMGWSNRWRYRGLYFSETAMSTINGMLGIDRWPYFSNNTLAEPSLVAQFLSLHRSLGEDQDPLAQGERLAIGLGSLLRHSCGPPPPELAGAERLLVGRLIDLIRSRYSEPLTLEDLAREAALTPFQLIGLFKRTTGLPPHAYLVQVRLTAAMAAMRRGRPIADAATSAGFYDQSALTKHFKRSFGITPLQWIAAASG